MKNRSDSQDSFDNNEFIPSNETRLYLEQKDDKEAAVGSYLFGSTIGLTGAFQGIQIKPKTTNTTFVEEDYEARIEKSTLSNSQPYISPTTTNVSKSAASNNYEERKDSLLNLEAIQQQGDDIGTTKQEGDGESYDKIVNMLCEHADGFEILSKRVKETLCSTKDVSSFMKKRAQIEESYALEMQKLCTSYTTMEGGKQGSFGEMWQGFIKMHSHISKQREKFAANLNEMSENIEVLHRNTARGRKQVKI